MQVFWYDYVVVFVIVYIVATFLEYFNHKYIMHKHLFGLSWFKAYYDSHIKHHIDAAKDKDFKMHEDTLEDMCFHLGNSIILGFQAYLFVVLITLVLYKFILKRPIYKFIFIWSAVFVFITLMYVIVTWNTWHPIIHGLDGRKVCGMLAIPKDKVNKDGAFGKFIIDNHKTHHYYKHDEKGNYNITLPGADLIMGSYKKMP